MNGTLFPDERRRCGVCGEALIGLSCARCILMGRERPPAVNGAPETSRQAAQAKVSTAERQREQVFEALEARGSRGATNAELEELTGLSGDSIRPRIWELRGENRQRPDLPVRVVDSGERRKTPSGRGAVVWTTKDGSA